MVAPTTLFLNFQDDSKFHVIDENNNTIGSAYEIPDAIKEARKVTTAPIDIEESYEGFTRLCVPEKPDNAIADSRQFIAALAEIAGMKVIEHYDDNVNFLGYTMELAEDTFIEAELAAEAHENKVVNALGSYMEDD